jgi:hypothetical protein
LEHVDELRTVPNATIVRREALVVNPLDMPERLAGASEQAIVARCQDEWAIARVECLVRNDIRMCRAHRSGHDPADEVVGRLIDHGGHARIEQRHVDVDPSTGPVAISNGGENADRRVQTGHDVEQGNARLHRFPARRPSHAHQSAERLRDDVVPRPTGCLAHVRRERREGARHEPVVGRAQRVEADPERRQQARPKVLDHDVGLDREAAHPDDAFVGVQIEDDGALVAVECQEVRGVVASEWRSPLARIVADVGAFDLDDVGAEIAKHHRAQRSREDARQIDDAKAVERQCVLRHVMQPIEGRSPGLRSPAGALERNAQGGDVSPVSVMMRE